MTVFIVQDDGRRDFSGAKRFGDLEPLIGIDAYPDNAHERVPVMTKIMRAKLKDFRPLHDFLLLTGDPIAISLATAVITESGTASYCCLKWDRENKGYFSVWINL